MFKGRALFVPGMLLIAVGCSEPEEEAVSQFGQQATGQQPINPNASQKTRDVLSLLYELPDRADRKVISGQVMHPLEQLPDGSRVINWDGYDRVRWIHDQTGYWVGIAGAEYTDWGTADGTQNQQILSAAVNPGLIEHSNKGGIAEIHFHPLSPKNGTYDDVVTADELLDPGPVHENWMRLLSESAAGLAELRDNDVVVLWRPFHGSDLSWWWAPPNMSNEDYRRVWSHMVDYFSNVWGLDNILYFQSWYGGGIYSDIFSRYAGSENVDIVGLDHNAISAVGGEYETILSFGKAFGISESWGTDGGSTNGQLDTRWIISTIKQTWPRCAFFIQFSHPRYPNEHLTANLYAGELLADSWIVNAPIFDAQSTVTCGNGNCEGGENCASCQADCGSCQPGSCGASYGGIGGVKQICVDDANSCELAFSSTTQSCTQICSQGGGACQAVYNNLGACGHAEGLSCDDNVHESAVCVCSQGSSSCGDNSCNSGESCSSCPADCGACQGCAASYGGVSGVGQICLETAGSCELAYSAQIQTCSQICSQGGGTCQAVYNNIGTCGHAEELSCDSDAYQSAVCICDNG